MSSSAPFSEEGRVLHPAFAPCSTLRRGYSLHSLLALLLALLCMHCSYVHCPYPYRVIPQGSASSSPGFFWRIPPEGSAGVCKRHRKRAAAGWPRPSQSYHLQVTTQGRLPRTWIWLFFKLRFQGEDWREVLPSDSNPTLRVNIADSLST